jgi:serine/threonine-protein kinase
VTATGAPGTVVNQSPAAGSDVAEATVVVLEVAAARTVTVPDVTGARSSEARSRIQALGLRVTQRPAQSSRPAGEVLSQSPAAGSELREGAVVTLRVSTGPSRIELPDVTGLDETAATRELEAAGFEVTVVDEDTTEPADDGVVLRQSPRAGRELREGATVTITVGRLS